MFNSNLVKELKLSCSPIAVILSDEIPQDGIEFDPSKMKGICSLSALKEALTGKTIFFSSSTKGCPGLKSGLGFQDETNMPGGIEYFLSCGRGPGFPEGEKLKKTPEIAKAYYDNLPKKVMNSKYIIFKPIELLDNEDVKLVIFIANPDQLSALISLFAYESSILDNVIAPMTSGCSSMIKLPLAELQKDTPRAIIGLVDIWARPLFEANMFTLSVPYSNYLRMEENSKDCFLQVKTWDGVKERL